MELEDQVVGRETTGENGGHGLGAGSREVPKKLRCQFLESSAP